MLNSPAQGSVEALVTLGADRGPVVHFDGPPGGFVSAPASEVLGWISSTGEGPIKRPALVNGRGAVVELGEMDRQDVRDAFPARRSAGFRGVIDVRVAVEGPWKLRYEQSGRALEADCTLTADTAEAKRFAAAKRKKLTEIRDLLRCPYCKTVLEKRRGELRCAAGHVFAGGANAFDFLDAPLRSLIGAIASDNISAHGYDATLIELISQSSGPILDVGAGLRPSYRPDVINVEIVPYPTTDVVCASEYLPFADASFDLVISVAVLEHVRDPFAAAKELMRVLRPGGRIFAAVPFLQPYHAYPNHYYNMTCEGLRNLFAGLDVERLDVPLSGGPIYALTWILQAWRRNLPPEVAAAFDAMRVAELAVDPMQLIDMPFVRMLPEEINVQLAALNVLVGRKPRNPAAAP